MTHDISSEQRAYLSDLFSRALKYQSQEQFGRGGVTQERITLTPYVATNYTALDLYNLVDITFDTFPYNPRIRS